MHLYLYLSSAELVRYRAGLLRRGDGTRLELRFNDNVHLSGMSARGLLPQL